MMNHRFHYRYLPFDGEKFFTMVLLPAQDGRFPTVVCRSPYVKNTREMSEDTVLHEYYERMKRWLDRGYAVVCQHCRGQGKSTGGFVPYVHEREDGLALRAWIRTQAFYNGELYLFGASYTASLHYATAPFEADVKGAVFEVQDSERYRLWYRNGQMRRGHANWHFGLYKDQCGLEKHFCMRSFSELPLAGLSERALGERAEDFEQMLAAASPDHPFWQTHFGGSDARDAVTDANIPILLTTGYNDFYIGGVFRMWERMSDQMKEKCALLVSPYHHGDGYYEEFGVSFPNGQRREAFGKDYPIAWFDHIRRGTPLPFPVGVITYYRVFENTWASDFYKTSTTDLTLSLGNETLSFFYDPAQPPAFREEGLLAEDFDGRGDVVTVHTPYFEQDTFVKGRMRMKLAVASSSADTSFYVRVSIEKKQYTYVLRHDITSLGYQLGENLKNDVTELEFCFDEYAFLIRKGERLRMDISSTDANTYVCHTNKKGDYYLQTTTEIAENRICLERSCLILPIE